LNADGLCCDSPLRTRLARSARNRARFRALPSARALLAIAIALAVFFLLNFVAVRTLLAAHPGRRGAIWTVTVIGNLMWLLLPFLFSARTTPVVRVTRAVLGPAWGSWLVFIILYSTFAVLAAALWFVFARNRMPFGRFAHGPSTGLLILLGIATVVGIYQCLFPLRIERVPIRIRGLAPELAGYRIAQVSDLHVGLFSRPSRLRTISRRINELRPDLLAVSGDMVDDDPYYVPKLLRGLESVDPKTKMVAVLGNHEIYGNPHGVIRALDRSRLELLVNRGVSLRDGKLWLAGVSDYAAGQRGGADLRPDVGRALEGRPADATPILLSHQPAGFDDARAHGIPFTMCGHTHGGQLGIRSLGWSLAGVFLPYDMGLYEEDGSQLYVNTGTGYWVVPFRLGMTPEITLFELSP
jgi:predicted MPP superfamily phosphohydrolase